MKKIIYAMLFLTLVGIGFGGCKKESMFQTTSEKKLNKDISINQNVLSFKTIEVYEKFISNKDTSLVSNILKSIKETDFKSYQSIQTDNFQAKSMEDNEDEYNEFDNDEKNDLNKLDDFIEHFLNKDGAIVIENYLFKIDIPKHTVYAIKFDVAKDSYNKAISKIIGLEKEVLILSMDDDIFDLLSLNENNFQGKAKNECSKGVKNTNKWFDYYDNKKSGKNKLKYRARLRLEYLNIGIYRSLTTKFEHQKKQGSDIFWKDDYNSFNIAYSVSWKNNAGGQTGQVFHHPTAYEYYAKSKKIKHYSGTKCLRTFDLRSWSRFLNKGNPNMSVNIIADEDQHIKDFY